MWLVKVHRAPLPAARVPQLAPATDLVGRAAIEVRVHKTLRQRDRMLPHALPVRTQPSEHELHKPADQIGVMALRQHVQARVVDHQGQALAPLRLPPADKGVPGLEMQRGRAPGGDRQPLTPPDHRIAQLLAHQLGAVQIMVLDEDSVALFDVVGPDQQFDLHLAQHGLLVSTGPTKRNFTFWSWAKR